MTKKIFYALFLIAFGLVLLTGCGSSTDTSTTTDKTDDTTTEASMDDSSLDARFTQYGNDLKDELDLIKTKAEDATGSEAAALKDSADAIGKRVDDMTAYLKDEVENDKLTQDAYDTLEKDLTDIKTDAETTSKDLEEKAAGATATAEDKLSYIDSKDGVDKVLDSIKTGTKDLEEDAKNGTEASATYVKETVKDTEDYLDSLGARIDKLVSDNVITEDVKKAYDDDIASIKADLDKVDESIKGTDDTDKTDEASADDATTTTTTTTTTTEATE